MGNAKSAVIVVSGVNGVGKTTSIGNLENILKTIIDLLFLEQQILLEQLQ